MIYKGYILIYVPYIYNYVPFIFNYLPYIFLKSLTNYDFLNHYHRERDKKGDTLKTIKVSPIYLLPPPKKNVNGLAGWLQLISEKFSNCFLSTLRCSASGLCSGEVSWGSRVKMSLAVRRAFSIASTSFVR